MDVTINDFQPRPLSVIDEQEVMVTLDLFAIKTINDCVVRFENRNQSTAELFDNDETNDIILSEKFIVPASHSSTSHQLGFKLQGATRRRGANITLDVTVLNKSNVAISQSRSIAVTIHAH